jgi:hypothetical protein
MLWLRLYSAVKDAKSRPAAARFGLRVEQAFRPAATSLPLSGFSPRGNPQRLKPETLTILMQD